MTDTQHTSNERNFTITLGNPHRVNHPWLEAKAIALEEALIQDCSGCILGPSVTALFDENGWELDLTVEADNAAEAYEKLGKAFDVIERVAGITITLDGPSDEIRSGWSDDTEPEHEQHAVLA